MYLLPEDVEHYVRTTHPHWSTSEVLQYIVQNHELPDVQELFKRVTNHTLNVLYDDLLTQGVEYPPELPPVDIIDPLDNPNQVTTNIYSFQH